MLCFMNAETFETTIIASESNIDTDSTISLFQALESIYPLASAIYVKASCIGISRA